MNARTSTAIASLALVGGLYLGTVNAKPTQNLTPVTAATAHYVDKAAVISALSTRAQIVGLTGSISKDVTLTDNAWYGDKTYTLAATGTFKLGVNTGDIIVTTHGNTVTVKFPQPKIVSVELPFDKATISKDVGMMRKNLTEAELQSLYGKAREGAVEDIQRNRQAFDKAGQSVERTIETLLAPIDGVEDVEFTN